MVDMIKLVIFDLDGTLIDSLGDLANAVEYALAENGYPPNPRDSYRYFVGKGASEEEIKRVHKAFSGRYREHCLELTKPYPGIEDMLRRLNESGIKLAVASNKPDEFSKQIVTALFGDDKFDTVHGKREGVPTKPSPDIIYSIMDELGVSAEETVVVGDSDVDVETAQGAGLKCIGCAWGFRGTDELCRAGADKIALNSDELTDIILEAAE